MLESFRGENCEAMAKHLDDWEGLVAFKEKWAITDLILIMGIVLGVSLVLNLLSALVYAHFTCKRCRCWSPFCCCRKRTSSEADPPQAEGGEQRLVTLV
jgi:hypothetical protein